MTPSQRMKLQGRAGSLFGWKGAARWVGLAELRPRPALMRESGRRQAQ